MSRSLAETVLEAVARQPIIVRVGVVTDNSPVEVNLAGQTGLSASHLDSYTPVVDDVVLLLQTPADLIILGQIVSGG